ncbi:MAG: AMP-binding protein [Xanthobacteraceae bacterium]
MWCAEWTFGELLKLVRSCAAGLQTAGVEQGDRVIVMMPNGPTGLLALFAANCLGAIFVPINPALKGALLQHVLSGSSARFAIVDGGCLKQVIKHAPTGLSTIFSAGEVHGSLYADCYSILPIDQTSRRP